MVRRAFHIRIAEDKRDAYREAHENVPEALEAVYLENDAGLTRYSIFEAEGHVFGYLEVEEPDALDESLTRYSPRLERIGLGISLVGGLVGFLAGAAGTLL